MGSTTGNHRANNSETSTTCLHTRGSRDRVICDEHCRPTRYTQFWTTWMAHLSLNVGRRFMGLVAASLPIKNHCRGWNWAENISMAPGEYVDARLYIHHYGYLVSGTDCLHHRVCTYENQL